MNEEDLIETRKVLELYGIDTLNSMRNILSSAGKIASGNLVSSLSYQITYNDSNLDIEFQMPQYGEFVDKGRKPGKQPPLSNIQQWLQVRGIPQSAAFPIARKIGKQGIKPTPFFQTSIDLGQDKLISDLEVAFTKDYEKYLEKQINEKF